MAILAVRHGETDEDNPADPKFSGPGDIKLNEKGRAQMEDAAAFLKSNFSIYWLLTSPIPRAKESADILGERLDLVPRIYPAARDWDNGAVAGHSVSKILPFVLFFERNPDLKIPGGESYGTHWDRHGEGFENLKSLPYEQLDIAVSTHSRWIANAIMRIRNNPKHPTPTDFSLSPKPGGVVKFSKGTDGYLTAELVFGEWNGDTR